MNEPSQLTTEQVAELVMANRVIRAPDYRKDHDEGVEFTDPEKGLQWGADAVPALLGLFRVERDPRDDHPDGWVGFARHWRGGTMRLEFELFSDSEASEPVLVVTAMAGRAGTGTITDEEFGTVELPADGPTQAAWEERDRRYHAARRTDDSDGSTAVRAFIASLPGWKRDVAEQFDALVERELPNVRRAVKYHQPFYGLEGSGWFASFSAFSKHVKLSFVCDDYLDPEPPSGTGPARQAIDLTAEDTLDEAQVGSWLRQAAEQPGMGW